MRFQSVSKSSRSFAEDRVVFSWELVLTAPQYIVLDSYSVQVSLLSKVLNCTYFTTVLVIPIPPTLTRTILDVSGL